MMIVHVMTVEEESALLRLPHACIPRIAVLAGIASYLEQPEDLYLRNSP